MISETLAVAATVIGAGISLSGILQICRILKRKSSGDISLILIFVVFISYIIWLLYGLDLMNYPLIIVNTLGTIVFGTGFFITLKYHKK